MIFKKPHLNLRKQEHEIGNSLIKQRKHDTPLGAQQGEEE